MKITIKTFGILLFLIAGHITFAQTNTEKALEKGKEAIKLMDNGDVDKSIILLKEAQILDPGRFDYPYEIAYAYHLKKDYKEAISILEKISKHKDVSERLFQLLGNTYDLIGNSDKAFKVYDEGLKLFPNSGMIYLEKGNVHWGKQDYIKALSFYEKGIEVDPTFPSNYYRAARIYCNSSEEVWGMIYGELFMNLERNSERTSEISKLLYDTYKREIKFLSDTSFSMSFSKNATIDVSDLKDPNKLKLPYGIGVYEPNLMISILPAKSIDINSLDQIRSSFIDNYYSSGYDKKYSNVLFSYQKTVKDAGHIEAYNHWILMKGDEEAFEKWRVTNENKWNTFVKWFSDNGLEISSTHKFYSGQY